jgi:hypothetical protein
MMSVRSSVLTGVPRLFTIEARLGFTDPASGERAAVKIAQEYTLPKNWRRRLPWAP